MKLQTAIIPVAGLGTRFLPITKAVPKELLPLVDRPILEYIIDEARSSGIKNIILVNSRGKGAIEDYFDYSFDEKRFAHKQELIADSHAIARDVNIISVRQPEPLGLGHAVLCARDVVSDPAFAVLLGDDVIDADPPCLKQLVDVHEQMNGAPVVGVMEIEPSDSVKYGIVGGEMQDEKLMHVTSLIEKPKPESAPSNLAIPGRYILTQEIFSILGNTKASIGGEIQLTDALMTLATKRPFYAYKFKGHRFDAGTKLGFLEANLHFALKRKDFRSTTLEIIERTVSEKKYEDF